MDIGKVFRDAWGLFAKDIGPLIVGILIASLVPAVAAVVIAAVTFGASFRGLEVDSQGTVTSIDSTSLALLIIGSVAIIVVVVLLTAPLYVGILSGVLRRIREGREMAYGDAFTGFRLFGKVVWATILLGLIFTAIILVPAAVIAVGAVMESALVAVLGAALMVVAMVAYVYLVLCWAYVFPVIVDRGLGVTAAMAESRRLVHATGWWWTFLVLFVLQLVVGAASFVLGLIPFAGAIATIILYPFVLTYLVAMYFQARNEGQLIDAVLGWPRPIPAGPPAYSAPTGPYGVAPVAPAPPAPPPAADQGQAYAPAPAPLTPPNVPVAAPQPEQQTAVTHPAAPEAPTPPEPPARGM